jgi:hypothetical protein
MARLPARAAGGTLLGEGHTGDVFLLSGNGSGNGGDGLAWAGLAADPFTADLPLLIDGEPAAG